MSADIEYIEKIIETVFKRAYDKLSLEFGASNAATVSQHAKPTGENSGLAVESGKWI